MKPLLTKTKDPDSLEDLGRASLQIIHDLKNQLNGLKLYATFLRRRWENTARPEEERETLEKLMAGLDRAAIDLSALLEYGRPIELKKQPNIDLQEIMLQIVFNLTNGPGAKVDSAVVVDVDSEDLSLAGEFDPAKLAEALKIITMSVIRLAPKKDRANPIKIQLRRRSLSGPTGVIEWKGLKQLDHDPFRSFVGSEGIQMSLAARIVEAHGGSAVLSNSSLCITLPLNVAHKHKDWTKS